MKTGIANLPLHSGSAPAWLFRRMRNLAREISKAIIFSFGPQTYLAKISDPFWFQALGCVLGFDWHSSGLTTTVTGAIKEGIWGIEKDLGFFACGGKGRTSRKTPDEIEHFANCCKVPSEGLIYASKMAAKVDTVAVQDGYNLYHHAFFFTKTGSWAVIQQGMNTQNYQARRYHWLSDDVQDFVVEPHKAICSDKKSETLNLVAKESEDTRKMNTKLALKDPRRIGQTLKKLKNYQLPTRHQIILDDIDPHRVERTLLQAQWSMPKNFEQVIATPGIGPKTIRALTLISELIYGARPSFRDPARFAFAHGGKDGIPYPVDRENYDQSIQILKKSVNHARLGRSEKLLALKRLATNYEI